MRLNVDLQLTLNISLLPRPRLVKLSFGMYLQTNLLQIDFANVDDTTKLPREASDDS